MFSKVAASFGACALLAVRLASATAVNTTGNDMSVKLDLGNGTTDNDISTSNLTQALAFAMINATDCNSCYALLGP
jgi:hypothetical protein